MGAMSLEKVTSPGTAGSSSAAKATPARSGANRAIRNRFEELSAFMTRPPIGRGITQGSMRLLPIVVDREAASKGGPDHDGRGLGRRWKHFAAEEIRCSRGLTTRAD